MTRVFSGRLIAIIAAGGLLVAGCGSSARVGDPAGSHASAPRGAAVTRGAKASDGAHPQAVEPVAGASAAVTTTSGSGASVSTTSGAGVADNGSAGRATEASLARPASLATIRRELSQSGMSASTDQATLTSNGLAIAPIGAPAAVQEIIAAGNQISHLPYIWGGGHEEYEDTGYDCSGSLSYVLAAAHLLDTTMTSGQLMSWGKPGPGRWISVYATDGHTFMEIAGLRFDTVALAETGTRWSNRPPDEPDLSSFVVRHPAGL